MTMKAGGGWMPRVGGREELKEMEKTGPEQHVHFIFHLLKILKSKRDLVDISIIFSLFIFGFFFPPRSEPNLQVLVVGEESESF